MEAVGIGFMQEQASLIKSPFKLDAETVFYLTLEITGNREIEGNRRGAFIRQLYLKHQQFLYIMILKDIKQGKAAVVFKVFRCPHGNKP